MKTKYNPEVQAWLRKFNQSERITTWYTKIIDSMRQERTYAHDELILNSIKVLERYLNNIRYKPKIFIDRRTFGMIWAWALRYIGEGDHGVDWEFFEYTWSYIETGRYNPFANPYGNEETPNIDYGPHHLPNTHNRRPTDY